MATRYEVNSCGYRGTCGDVDPDERGDFVLFVDHEDELLTLRQQLTNAVTRAEAAEAACQFAVDRCVSRTAGNTNNPFAWMPQKHWDTFVAMAAQQKGGA